MTPPAGPGQVRSLQTHYDKIGDGFVGFIDETYHLEKDGRGRFYTIAAVVVAAADLEPLRQDLDNIVPGGWWHTSNQLQNDQGYEDTLKLLATLEPSSDVCVIVDHVDVSDNVDADEGLTVRAEVWAASGISDSGLIVFSTLPRLAAGNYSGRRWGAGNRGRSAGGGCCRTPQCRR